jgi:hypothetical protein
MLVLIRNREQNPDTWTQVATARYHHQPDTGWFLSEVQGRANRAPGTAVREIRDRLATTLIQQACATRSRKFYCPRTASFNVRQRRGCPIRPMVEVRLGRLSRGLREERWVGADQFEGRYWCIERSYDPVSSTKRVSWTDEVVTTGDVFAWLDRGHSVTALDGPFATEDDACYALHLAWESPE